MTCRQRGELLCGIGAILGGIPGLLLAYLQPYAESNATAMNVVKFHPGFTAIETPYIIAVGLPILGIMIGAVTNSLTESRSAQWLLWIATGILGVEMLVGAISGAGALLIPSVAFGICASLLSHAHQGGDAHAMRTTA